MDIGLDKGLVAYLFSIGLIFLTLFKDIRYGIFYFLPLIPLRFLFEKTHQFPLGKDLVDIMIAALIIRWILFNKGFLKTKISKVLSIYIFLMFLSLLNGYLYLGGHPSLDDYRLQFWKDYIFMPIIFFIILNNIKKLYDIKKIVFIISLIFLVVVLKFYFDFSETAHFHFNEQNREVSVFGYLGPNPLAAFVVVNMIIFLTIQYLYKNNKKFRNYYLFVSLISFYPLLFSYSRGGYIAASAVLLLLGIIKDRRILVACFCFLLLWQVILPNSVLERIKMTSDEGRIAQSESRGRAIMWGLAFDTFKSNPVFGVGFRSFENQELEGAPIAYTAYGQQKILKSVHNLYIQVMAEMGIIGIIMLMYLFFRAFRSGWQLYKTTSDNFLKGLGLGFSLCVVASMILNIFGDRWHHLIIQINFWMFWALVERALIITRENNKLTELL